MTGVTAENAYLSDKLYPERTTDHGQASGNFITCDREWSAPFLQFTKPGANPRVLVIGLYELLGNPTV